MADLDVDARQYLNIPIEANRFQAFVNHIAFGQIETAMALMPAGQESRVGFEAVLRSVAQRQAEQWGRYSLSPSFRVMASTVAPSVESLCVTIRRTTARRSPAGTNAGTPSLGEHLTLLVHAVANSVLADCRSHNPRRHAARLALRGDLVAHAAFLLEHDGDESCLAFGSFAQLFDIVFCSAMDDLPEGADGLKQFAADSEPWTRMLRLLWTISFTFVNPLTVRSYATTLIAATRDCANRRRVVLRLTTMAEVFGAATDHAEAAELLPTLAALLADAVDDAPHAVPLSDVMTLLVRGRAWGVLSLLVEQHHQSMIATRNMTSPWFALLPVRLLSETNHACSPDEKTSWAEFCSVMEPVQASEGTAPPSSTAARDFLTAIARSCVAHLTSDVIDVAPALRMDTVCAFLELPAFAAVKPVVAAMLYHGAGDAFRNGFTTTEHLAFIACACSGDAAEDGWQGELRIAARLAQLLAPPDTEECRAALFRLLDNRCSVVELISESGGVDLLRARRALASLDDGESVFDAATVAPQLAAVDAAICCNVCASCVDLTSQGGAVRDTVTQAAASISRLRTDTARSEVARDLCVDVMESLLRGHAVAELEIEDQRVVAAELRRHFEHLEHAIVPLLEGQAAAAAAATALSQLIHRLAAMHPLLTAAAAAEQRGLLFWLTCDPAEYLAVATQNNDVAGARSALHHLFSFDVESAWSASNAAAVEDAYAAFQQQQLADGSASANAASEALSAGALRALGPDVLFHVPSSTSAASVADPVRKGATQAGQQTLLGHALDNVLSCDDGTATVGDVAQRLLDSVTLMSATRQDLTNCSDGLACLRRMAMDDVPFDVCAFRRLYRGGKLWLTPDETEGQSHLLRAVTYLEQLQGTLTLLYPDGRTVADGRAAAALSAAQLLTQAWPAILSRLTNDAADVEMLLNADGAVTLHPGVIRAMMCRQLADRDATPWSAEQEHAMLHVIHTMLARTNRRGGNQHAAAATSTFQVVGATLVFAHAVCRDAAQHDALFSDWVRCVAADDAVQLSVARQQLAERSCKRLRLQEFTAAIAPTGSNTTDRDASVMLLLEPHRMPGAVWRAVRCGMDAACIGNDTSRAATAAIVAAFLCDFLDDVLLAAPADNELADAVRLLFFAASTAEDGGSRSTAVALKLLFSVRCAAAVTPLVIANAASEQEPGAATFGEAHRHFAALVSYSDQFTLLSSLCGDGVAANANDIEKSLESLRACRDLHAAAAAVDIQLGQPIPFQQWTADDVQELHGRFVAAGNHSTAMLFAEQCAAQCSPAAVTACPDLVVSAHCARAGTLYSDAIERGRRREQAEYAVIKFVTQIAQKEFGEGGTAAVDGTEAQTLTVRVTAALADLKRATFPDAARLHLVHRLLRYVLESAHLSPLFVADTTWRRSLLGISTQLCFEDASVAAEDRADLAATFDRTVFLSSPALVVENLVRTGHFDLVALILRRVPSLHFDETLMHYALRAIDIAAWCDAPDDRFPFGCDECMGPDAAFDSIGKLVTPMAATLHPGLTVRQQETLRDAFEYATGVSVVAFAAVSSLCADKAFMASTCFDHCITLFDTIPSYDGQAALQLLIADVGERVTRHALQFVAPAAGGGADLDFSGAEHGNAFAEHAELRKLHELFGVAKQLVSCGYGAPHNYDDFCSAPDVMNIIGDLMASQRQSAAFRVATACSDCVDHGLDTLWIDHITLMIDLDLIDRAEHAMLALQASGKLDALLPVFVARVEHTPVPCGFSVDHGKFAGDLVVKRVEADDIPSVVQRRRDGLHMLLTKFGTTSQMCGFAMRLRDVGLAVEQAVNGDMDGEAFNAVVLNPCRAMGPRASEDLRSALFQMDPTLVDVSALIDAVCGAIRHEGPAAELELFEWLQWRCDYAEAADVAMRIAVKAATYDQKMRFFGQADAGYAEAKFQPHTDDAALAGPLADRPESSTGVVLVPTKYQLHELKTQGLRCAIRTQLVETLHGEGLPVNKIQLGDDVATQTTAVRQLFVLGSKPLVEFAFRIIGRSQLPVVELSTAAVQALSKDKKFDTIATFTDVVKRQMIAADDKAEVLYEVVRSLAVDHGKLKLAETVLPFVASTGGPVATTNKAFVACGKVVEACRDACGRRDTASVVQLRRACQVRPRLSPHFDGAAGQQVETMALVYLEEHAPQFL
jgi:hypothetical protein